MRMMAMLLMIMMIMIIIEVMVFINLARGPLSYSAATCPLYTWTKS